MSVLNVLSSLNKSVCNVILLVSVLNAILLESMLSPAVLLGPLPCCSCPRARIPGGGSVFHLPSDIITLLVTDEPVTTPQHPDQDPRAIIERLKNDAEDVEQLTVELRARYEVARAGLEATDDFGAGAGDVQAKTEGKEAAKNIWIRCRKCKEAHGRERRM